MHRRAFVATLCAGLAGCSSLARGVSPLGPAGTGKRAPARRGSFEVDGDVFAERTVGTDEGGTTHELLVWNDGPASEIAVSIRGNEVGTLLDEGFEFPKGGVLRVTIRPRDTYRVLVKRQKRREYRVPIDAARFDCDGARTAVRVPQFGRAVYTTSGTDCGTPSET